ncbi:MAG: type I DNA topoisomerase [Nitrospirota bacterium]|jgi:DNA topoisomerase-1
MASKLVIVESPAKARTINKILGKQYAVKASVGHVKDLPAKVLGVEVKDAFRPDYQIIPGKEKVVKELKQAAAKARDIYLAPDPDREGEAIAYHIATEINGAKEHAIHRVTFNEITARAVKEAMEHPGRIDMDKVEAQQARRVLDRLVGYQLSPLLWKKVRRGLSAGRVQSVALRLVVDREREIEAFKQEEYWSIVASLAGPKPPAFNARLHTLEGAVVINRDAPEGERFLLTSAEQAERAAGDLRQAEYTLSGVEKKLRRRSPAAPFTTSTLQQEASRKLGFAAKKTMVLAQQLYEGVELGPEGAVGLITYMRTDSVRVAAEAQAGARKYIRERFGKDYLPPSPPAYKSKAGAQEAHEAVRPTLMTKPPEAVKPYLSRDQQRLYTLIWNRFMASQMKPAELEQTTFEIAARNGAAAVFRATGNVMKFPGFMALYSEGADQAPGEEEEGAMLPPLAEGDRLTLKELLPRQHFTQPPPRYTEASLVRTLEEKGIGRPSTYAAILSTIADRKYVHREDKRFVPTELGMVVNDYLVENFAELLDLGFTARMEDKLDKIETGDFRWVDVVKDFYGPFEKDLVSASQVQGKVKPKDIETNEVCEKCGAPMVIRWGRHGRFLACSAYPACKNTRPLEGEKREAPEEKPTGEVCPTCGAPMVLKRGRFGPFIACSRYPECKTTKPLSTGVKCPEDGGDLIERRTKRGKPFWSCSNYPQCKFAIWHKPIPEKCPACGAPFMVIKKERSGQVVKSCIRKECGHKEELKEPEAA